MGLLTVFPTPILSIAPDAVRDLEGRDALSALWTLFAKCKESLEDGRRLENISWRLWYREMMRDDLMNRPIQEQASEKEDPDHVLSPQVAHTDLYRPPTPSESESRPAPSTYAVQDANGLLNDSTLNYRPPLMSATIMLPQDHDLTTPSPTFSSSILRPTQVNMFRPISPADPAPCTPFDPSSASLQVSKSNSNPLLSPVAPVHPFSPSSSSSGSKSPNLTDVPPHVRASSVQSTQRRKLTGFQTPTHIGRIIYDMLPCSASSEGWVRVWPPSMTTTTTKKFPSAESPAVETSIPARTSVALVGLPNAIDLASATTAHATTSSMPSSSTNSRYTSLHAAPPSPSLSDSYVNAHPEFEVSNITQLDVGVGLGPSLSVSASSPSSPQMLGDSHIFGLSSNPQPPRLVVVNPTPNPTPHPTPPASPLSGPVFSSASSASSDTRTSSNDYNDVGGTKGNWLTLPSNHHPNRIQDPRQDQNHDRSRSDYVTTTVTARDINFASSSSFLPPQSSQSPPHHQTVNEDQLPASPFVQDLEISANFNSNRHSISSITTNTSTATDSTAISTATAATSAFLDEASELEELEKTVQNDKMWISDAVVVGSPVDNVDVDAHPISKAGGSDPSMGLGLDFLLAIHSTAIEKGGDDGDDCAVSTDVDTDVEELDEELADGGSSYLINVTTTPAAVTTKKKKIGMKKRIKTKTKPVKRNSLRSPTSTLSQPQLPLPLHQPTSSSSTKQNQVTSSGRGSSRSMSRSGRSSAGVGVGVGTNSSVSRSRSRIRGASLGMTRATSGDRKKPVVVVSTKLKNRPKFMLGSKGKGASSSGKYVGGTGGSTIIRKESSGGSGAGAEENSNTEKEKERERERRGRERMIAKETIQMQRRQQSLIQQQQQQQLEIKQREDEHRALTAQLARQDPGVHDKRRRSLHEQQGQGVRGGMNGLLSVSSKRPVAFNIGSNSDDGSGMGSNSKSGSEFSGVERLMIPLVHPIVNDKGKERDDQDAAGILEQEINQPQQDAFRPPHQLGIVQQHAMAPHRPAPRPQPTPLQHQHLKPEKQLERQITRDGGERHLPKEEKGKGREHSNPNSNSKLSRTTSKVHINDAPPPPPANYTNTNTKHSTHETLNMVSSALAAKVKHTLADPLLPGQHKRTIVLTTSDSEYEDSDDDGSWSSEEMGSEDEQEQPRHDHLLAQQYQQQQQQQQQQLLQRQLQQQQQQQQPQRQLQQLQQLQQPPPLQRTHSNNHPPTVNHNLTQGANRTQRTQSSRGHRHPPNHAQGPALMTQAAQEAQRQRDMFAKKPAESFQNLTQVARTQSVGLLTQLMNPNPEIFPVGHPYRRGYSSSEIRGAGGGDRDRDRGFRPLQPLMDVKARKTDNAQDKSDERPPPSRPEAKHRKSSSPSAYPRGTAALSPPARTLSMQLTKSTAALPLSSQVQAGSVSTHTSNAVGGGHGTGDRFGMTNMKMTVSSNHSSGGYRPKGPPQDQELEDESGSEGESSSRILVSKSVAQQKLKALAERRGIVAHGNHPTTTTNGGAPSNNQKPQLGDEHDVPEWAKVSQPRLPTRTRSHDQYPQSQAQDHNANRRSLNALHFSQMAASTANHPTPIPVGHPYNLPPPAPPSTPRTTRRLMLSTELSESLRRNLLWERQVSKVNLAAAVRRTASSGGSRHSLLGGVQPLTTAAPNMVKLLPKGTMAHPNPGSPVRPEHGGGIKERRASGGAGDGPGPSVDDENEKERRRRLAMARNRSWANDYHFAGW